MFCSVALASAARGIKSPSLHNVAHNVAQFNHCVQLVRSTKVIAILCARKNTRALNQLLKSAHAVILGFNKFISCCSQGKLRVCAYFISFLRCILTFSICSAEADRRSLLDVWKDIQAKKPVEEARMCLALTRYSLTC